MAPLKKILTGSALAVLFLAGCGDPIGDRYVGFAKCLEEKGAKMYGSYLCPHCTEQKEMFGTQGARELPYIECHPNGPNSQTVICTAKNIQSVPLWEFADGSSLKGVQQLQTLADKTSCTLPAEPT